MTTPHPAAQGGAAPTGKVQLPDTARAGIEVLHQVVEALLTTGRYVDEEGEATQALADLSACIADPPFRLNSAPSVDAVDRPYAVGDDIAAIRAARNVGVRVDAPTVTDAMVAAARNRLQLAGAAFVSDFAIRETLEAARGVPPTAAPSYTELADALRKARKAMASSPEHHAEVDALLDRIDGVDLPDGAKHG